jgi:hypothetical protein
MKRRPAYATLTLLIPALLCASCGRADRKPVYPVRGKVLFDGRPVPQAFVAFHPLNDARADAVRPTGRTDKDGWFTLTTYTAQDGAPAGEYAVTVEWRRVVNTFDEGGSGYAPNRLPARYSQPTTSRLTVRVSEGPNELQPIRLTK